MIYKINDDYYIYRDRKYIKITAKLENEEVSLVPDMNTFIEDNNVSVKEISINDIQKELQEKNKKKDDKDTIRNKYSRDR